MVNRIYKPKEYWDAIGEASAVGSEDDSGRFGTDGAGNSLYRLPKWSTQPQYWDYMEPGIRVLDIGSGNGLQVGQLSQRGIFAVGCDISSVLLTIAKGNMLAHGVIAPMLVQWDGIKMPFASETLDRVTTNTVLQHVVDDDAVHRIFEETNRVLRNKGLFLICELVSPQDMQTAPHVKLRSTRTYERIAARYGLRVKKTRHVVSTYVTIQSIYARLVLRTSTRPQEVTLSDTTDYNSQSNNCVSVALFVKQFLQHLISVFARTADRSIIFLHLDDRLAGQDVIVFEKYFP